MFWPRRNSAKAPLLSYAPSEFQTKPWLTEAPIENWFPPFAEKEPGFDSASAFRIKEIHVERQVASGYVFPAGKPNTGSLNPSARWAREFVFDTPLYRKHNRCIMFPRFGVGGGARRAAPHVCERNGTSTRAPHVLGLRALKQTKTPDEPTRPGQNKWHSECQLFFEA